MNSYINVRNNQVIETIKDIVIADGIAKVTVNSVEFEGIATNEYDFIAYVPVIVVK